jgi:hypothetical protein
LEKIMVGIKVISDLMLDLIEDVLPFTIEPVK